MRRSGVDGRGLVSTARRLLAAIGDEDASLSLTLVNDERIREINREHRGKDKPTDVLSFPMMDFEKRGTRALGARGRAARAKRERSAVRQKWGPQKVEHLLGDVVISVETARRQAADYDAPLQRELYRLLIHGLLHLKGHDHEKASERRVMEIEERRLARAIGMPWPYEAGS